MEASKCPKCGDEPHFVESVEKWYCYGCNEYIDDDEIHVHSEPAVEEPEEHAEEIAGDLRSLEHEDAQTCKSCGAELERIKDGKLYCYVCETYPDDVSEAARPEPKAEVVEEVAESGAQAVMTSVPEAAPAQTPVETIEDVKPETKVDVKMCSTCGQPMKWIEKYQRDYCYGCRKYAPKESPGPVAQTSAPDNGHQHCPECRGELKFIEKYNEYYCYACKKYPLRKSNKPSVAAAKPDTCPKCGGQLKLIEKYQRQYCYACKEYAPKGNGSTVPAEKKTCPTCSSEMKFVSEYNEWYCYKCKKYSLRPAKPVLLF